MKLGSLKGGRDGRLVVVSDDLAWCADADHLAPTLQAALDDWARIEPQLQLLATDLAHGVIPRDRFHEREADAPLPRAYQWADGSAYVNHVELVRKARGAEMPESFWTDPLMYQGASDEMLAPRDPIPLADEAGAATSRPRSSWSPTTCRAASRREEALDHIKLIGLVNDVSLRNLIPAELGKGFGFLQSKPASALSPVFVTPDDARRRMAGRQAPRRAQGRSQRPALRPRRRRRGHDLRFRHPGRPSRQDAKPRRRHDHRLGHGLQPATRTAAPASRSTAAAAAIPASPRCGRSRRSSTASRRRRSSRPATGSGSGWRTKAATPSSGRSSRRWLRRETRTGACRTALCAVPYRFGRRLVLSRPSERSAALGDFANCTSASSGRRCIVSLGTDEWGR